MAEAILEVDGIHFYVSPWVSGTRAKHYHGPMGEQRRVAGCKAAVGAIVECVEVLAARANAVKANAMVGMEISIHIEDGDWYTVYVVGTVATLEPLSQ